MMFAMPTMDDQDIYEIRWHGRGGQGAVTSSKILADAGFRSGFAGVTAQPSFGAERRGAPVTASTRLARSPLRTVSQVNAPDIVVVLDESLLEVGGATAGLKPGGTLIVNTTKSPEEFGVTCECRIVTADVTGAASAAGVVVGGAPMVNTAILGAIAAATRLIGMDSLQAAIEEQFAPAAAKKNYDAARLAYDCTRG